jgi:transposase
MALPAAPHRRDLTDEQWALIGPFLPKLARRKDPEGYLDLQEAFIDGSFAPAKRGGACVGKTKRGKGSKIMAIADRQGRPVAVHVESATPHEVTLVHATLAERLVTQLPVPTWPAASFCCGVYEMASLGAYRGYLRTRPTRNRMAHGHVE